MSDHTARAEGPILDPIRIERGDMRKGEQRQLIMIHNGKKGCYSFRQSISEFLI